MKVRVSMGKALLLQVNINVMFLVILSYFLKLSKLEGENHKERMKRKGVSLQAQS
jgi:hypothetical protein